MKPRSTEAWAARPRAHTCAIALLAAASLLGCGGWFKAPPPPRTVPASISDPKPPDLFFLGNDSADDAIVRLTTPHVACTGTLIGPRLVLTAHHCVAARDEFGEFLEHDVEADEVEVELGGDYLPWAAVDVQAIVAPPCGYAAGFGDIALLVLTHELEDVQIKEVRLDDPPKVGEEIRPSGFGQCSDSGLGVKRHVREGGRVDAVHDAALRCEAAVCPGDSGGPGVDIDGRVVGVISASAMDGKEHTKNVTEFTRLDRFRDVFAYALRLVEGENPAELPPLSCARTSRTGL